MAKRKIKEYLVGLAIGLGSFLLGFAIAGILSSNYFTMPKVSDLKTFPRAFIVQSGSMEPIIRTGSVVITLPKPEYLVGDVVTFRPNGRKNLVTHRIKDVKNTDSGPVYATQGDANNTPDNWELKSEDVIGNVFFTMPYVGYVADYAKKPYGFILLVIVPATIIIYEELKFLKNELFKVLRRIFKKRQPENLYSDKEEPKGANKASMAIPLAGAFLVLTALTGSYFLDLEESTGNLFSAAETFVTGVAEEIPLAPLSVVETEGANVSPTPTPSPSPTLFNEEGVTIETIEALIEDPIETLPPTP